MRAKTARQGELEFPKWGGRRRGAGRKRSADRAGVPHRARAPLASRFPVHVTLRLLPGLPSLRRSDSHTALRRALAAGSDRFGFRLVHYTALGNHVHLICEAKNQASLSRGMKGLCVRIARALNRLWTRAGSVLADRFHHRALRTPREVRNALCYVLHNARHHGLYLPDDIDPFSSSEWFDGWNWPTARERDPSPSRLSHARTWLLEIGWRRWGLLPINAYVSDRATHPRR